MTTLAVGNRRLLKLADILDTADEEHIRKGEPTYSQHAFTHPCGSPACALGHWSAAKHVARKRRNLPLMVVDAVDEFALDFDDACEIFGPLGCDYAQTAKDAAKYIRAFVKRRQK